MALSTEIKFKIITHLGYPAGTIISGNVNYSNIVVSRLGALPIELESHVNGLLTRLATLETQLSTALSRAGVKKIDDIELNGLEMESLRKEKRSVINELGRIFDLDPVSSVHSMGNICLG